MAVSPSTAAEPATSLCHKQTDGRFFLWQLPAEFEDQHMEIREGTFLLVTTASGAQVAMRALGSPVRGRDFPVVWVCTIEDYDLPDHLRHAIPWPLEAIEIPGVVDA
jgi:hypothetical protein